MHEHRLLVTGEALRAYRALGGALLGEPAEADEREPAALEELRDERQREHAPQTQPPGPLDAGVDERLPHSATGGLRPHRQRPDLRQIRREGGEGTAPNEA